jgi:hypothetical protein
MKLNFPWNMALLYCSRVFFESSQCWFQELQPVYPLLEMWQRTLDKQFRLLLAISHINIRHTPTSPNSIGPCHDETTRSICLTKCAVPTFKNVNCLIHAMIVTVPKLFTMFNLLIKVYQYPVVQTVRECYASSRLWFHVVELRYY